LRKCKKSWHWFRKIPWISGTDWGIYTKKV